MGYNKKGQGISLNFLIIAALALIALIVIALFFTGGISKLFGKKAEVIKASEQELALAKANCEFWCSTGVEQNFNNPPFSEAVKAAGFDKCEKFPGLGKWDDICASGVCEGGGICATKTNSKECTAAGSPCKWVKSV